MENDTPRVLIRRILRSSSARSSEGRANTTSNPFQTPSVSTTQPLPMSSSLKRSSQASVGRTTKKMRPSVSTPSETITPRTNIKNLLVTADNETPVVVARPAPDTVKVESLNVEKLSGESVPREPRSSISDAQFHRLVGSSPSSRSPSVKKPSSARRRSGRKQSFPTPSETITTRATIKTYLKAADTETPAEKRSEPPSETSTQTVAENDEGEPPLPTVDQAEQPNISDVQQGDNDVVPEVSMESSHMPSELPGPSDNELSYGLSDGSLRRDNSASSSSGGWDKLQTPVLPNETVSRASPVVIGGTNPLQHRKRPRNVKKVGGKKAGKTKTNAKSKPDAANRFPSSLVKGIFEHFSALKVSKEALQAIQVGSDSYFKNLSSDLMAYCKHAKRKTIEKADVELLMHRQGLLSSKMSLHALVEKYLPLEYRQEIIPVAMAGNKVVPKL